jgi:hypothetical protein
MKNDAGRAETAAPITYVTIGNVAIRREGASANPVRAFTVAISTPLLRSSI